MFTSTENRKLNPFTRGEAEVQKQKQGLAGWLRSTEEEETRKMVPTSENISSGTRHRVSLGEKRGGGGWRHATWVLFDATPGLDNLSLCCRSDPFIATGSCRSSQLMMLLLLLHTRRVNLHIFLFCLPSLVASLSALACPLLRELHGHILARPSKTMHAERARACFLCVMCILSEISSTYMPTNNT